MLISLQGQKSKLSQTYRVTHQNKRERGTKTMEKELAQSDQFGEKSKKPPENTVFQKSDISGVFLDFSPNW